jgi:enamine deaminase RidA (YjgF/YER057c/UK114 family)
MKSSVTYPRDPYPPRSYLPFSQAVRVGELIFVSGHASVDPAGQIVSDSFEGEFRRLVENLRKVRQAAGSDLTHVTQTRNYVRDPGDLALSINFTASISPRLSRPGPPSPIACPRRCASKSNTSPLRGNNARSPL